jgi:DNA-binding XRE family transcriptional regulator
VQWVFLALNTQRFLGSANNRFVEARFGNGKEENKPMLGVVAPAALLLCLRIVSRVQQQRKALGETIRHCRKQANLSQEKLAEKANLHPVYVGKVERGEQWVSLHALLRIAQALGVRLRDLVANI